MRSLMWTWSTTVRSLKVWYPRVPDMSLRERATPVTTSKHWSMALDTKLEASANFVSGVLRRKFDF